MRNGDARREVWTLCRWRWTPLGEWESERRKRFRLLWPMHVSSEEMRFMIGMCRDEVEYFLCNEKEKTGKEREREREREREIGRRQVQEDPLDGSAWVWGS